ncbi:MBOAT family O-acyltransferase [Carboxylicivirga sp. RSCT41]|uniref:MBOAT family O-acyltransferase n=1 Tax=Carboxylicivirga agarovorans TaxID=3417570 RepID=UPI003D35107D
MIFNSLDFAIFLPIVFCLYWFVLKNKLKLQNLLIVMASYVFYGWWDWRFLSLIIFSTLVDYTIGLKLKSENRIVRRKLLLWTSILVNLGFLGFFKYYNFFLDNFISAFSFFGRSINANSLNIILPVGISFYTFQTLSYTIDIYKRKLEPTQDFVSFAAFVSFFPQLVAGPIERATHLLPQFAKQRVFDESKASDGMRQILWGLFKKIVVADNCAVIVNQIFNDYGTQSSSTLFMGAIFFAFQIYGDFSGYSDIAIGTSRLFGFNLMQNFAFPYFSRDISEFWRRWHISLSTWFRDYVYIPLGGSRGGISAKIRNTLIIFIVSGFWHGANWTFIIWGAINALYFLPLLLLNRNRNYIEVVAKGKLLPSFKELIMMCSTFILVTFSWVFFRAENVGVAYDYILRMIDMSFFSLPAIDYKPVLYILILLSVEWINRGKKHGLEFSNIRFGVLRWSAYVTIFCLILFLGAKSQSFIYFQF